MVNASPIILLSKVGLVDLLQHLGVPIVIPRATVNEILRRGTADPAVQALARSPWLVTVDVGRIPAPVTNLKSGNSESAVLAYALAHSGSGVILDDRAARTAAASLGLPYQGTLGLILWGKRQGFLRAARPVIEQLRQHGMFLSDKLMNQALAQVGE